VKRRGDIRSAKVWQDDLCAFHELVRAKHPGVPVFWYAESLGGLVALHTGVSPDCAPAGMIISSPAAGLKIEPGFFKHMLLQVAMRVAPWKMVNLEKMAGVKDEDIHVTANTTHAAQMAITPHHVPEFTLRLLREVHDMIEDGGAAARRLTVPVLVLASPNDVIASPEQIRVFFEKIGSKDKTIRWYENSYHLLLHDVQREDVLRDATGWIEKRLR
jgi:alpha-beta hydrolase superfamily lysophospholipase